ncbi:MAG: hypothetical protein GY822_11580 [Deltaproteobacteria bacterium]|nr:hypothetical protein [Deltaproteobacteria bacterium]
MFLKTKWLSRRHFAYLSSLLVLSSGACVQTQSRSSSSNGKMKAKQVEKLEVEQSHDEKQVKNEPGRSAPRFETPKSNTRLALLWTASVQGYVAPCGCTAEPLGGIARHLALVNEAKEKFGERVLVLDAGDLLFEKANDHHVADECQANARVELLLSNYAKAKLAATTLGDLDDVRGAEWRDERVKKAGVLTLGVNLPRAITVGAKHSAGELFERGGLKIGVSAFFLDDKSLSVVNEDAKVVRPLLQAQVDSLLSKGAQAIVLLAQATRKQTRLMMNGVTGVDVVILGRRPGEQPTQAEQLSSGAVILAAGAQAQHIGIAELELGNRKAGVSLPLDDGGERARQRSHRLQKKIEQYQKQVAELDEGPRKEFVKERIVAAQVELKAQATAVVVAPEAPHIQVRSVALSRQSDVDKEALAALKGYEKSVPRLVSSCEENIVCEPAEPNMPTYVGAETCAGCHRAANRFWQKQVQKSVAIAADGTSFERDVGHVKAWDTLVEAGKESDRSCVGCHSIGFMEPGGYCKTSEVGFRTGVQCESCHGPGSLHITEGDARYLPRPTVDERTCRGCHQVPHIPSTESFVYNEKLLHILGKGHGENRANELRGAKR